MALPVAAGGAGIGANAGTTISVLAGHTMKGQPIPCAAQADGVRVCHGDESGVGGADLRLKSFDSSPLALNVILPPAALPALTATTRW
jgi:hypothetical protein